MKSIKNELLMKYAMKEDNQLLVLIHVSQLINLVTGMGGFIVPLIIWLTQKDTVYDMDRQGKMILNFQISMFIYALICVPLCFIVIGVFLLIIIGIISFVLPIINAIKVNKGEEPNYPLSITLIK
ncbi:hypothetical protein NBRC110019_04000 [Neptunitalea chrysea]|uniref:DUF4870 domain-containing protein n=2 Tax=Neptunitalea chrysea TaxID=1647581 RepID=A0A9W6B2S4_9FLAO|nr:hypothetical protein NBRC110019_04000 [Neptunitalea chrysea]